jgi:chromosome segregation ATPase
LGLAQEACPETPGEISLPPAEVEIDSMQQAFGQVIDFFALFIDEFKGSITAINDHFLSLEASFADLSARVDGIAEDIKCLWRRIDDHEGRIAALEEEDLGSLQRRVLAMEQAIQALQVKIDNNRAKVEGVEAALGGFQSDLESIKSTVSDLGTEIEAQQADITSLQDEIASLKAAQESMWGAIILVPILVGGLVYFLLSSG